MKSVHIDHLLQIFGYAGFSFMLALIVFPFFIRLIQRYKLTKKLREKTMTGAEAEIFKKLHAHKNGTPTMGGVVVIASVLCGVLLSWILSRLGITEISILDRGETYLPIFTMITVGALGVVDDLLNIRESSAQKGLSARIKFWTLFGFAILGALWFVFKLEFNSLYFPGLGNIDIGLWYFPLFVLVIIATAHSVNLTDGLDGLAGGLLLIAYSVFAAIAYAYNLPILALFCCMISAAIASFLWFNVPPAKIYMGDTGSLALGATLGVMAMMTNSLFILIIIGAIFIIETVSVILQLFWKKYFKRKLFLIAPIHHHFEALGWSETQIVMRFWLIGIVVGMLGVVLGLYRI